LSSSKLNNFAQAYVRPSAHCEYGAGFLIFDRWDSSKEVWRLASDWDTEQQPEVSRPDVHQLRISEFAERYGSANGRGHFKPWALLRMPTTTRAYRFVYPTLLVAGASEAYLWDIPSATLSQTIVETDLEGDQETHIGYVEISDRHVFICAEDVLRIFSREDGRAALDIHIPSTMVSCADLKFAGNSSEIHYPDAALQPYTLEPQHELGHQCRPPRNFDEFIAGVYSCRELLSHDI
jgi:hypothetical protein